MRLIILFVLFITIGFSFVQCSSKPEKGDVKPLTESWEIIVPNQKPPEGLTSLNAEYCGQCHQSHYKDWKKSTHAHAWTDEQFQSEIKKEHNPFFCINCHVPLQNQQEDYIDGLIDGDIYKPARRSNPAFDRSLQLEGITCAACHVRDGYIIGVSGKKNPVHKTRQDTKFLSEQLCISCHNAAARIKDDLVCTFETGDEWKNGKYYKKKNCIECHMPKSEGERAAGFPGMKRLHSFPGSGIAKHTNYEADKMNDLEIDFNLVKTTISKTENLVVDVSLKNENAGHQVPTGDPERFLTVTLNVKNKKAEIVFTKQERIGEKWKWSPIAKKISDNNLKVGENRSYTFESETLEPGVYQVEIKVEKFRMSRKNADYHNLSDTYPISRVIYKKSKKVIIRY